MSFSVGSTSGVLVTSDSLYSALAAAKWTWSEKERDQGQGSGSLPRQRPKCGGKERDGWLKLLFLRGRKSLAFEAIF